MARRSPRTKRPLLPRRTLQRLGMAALPVLAASLLLAPQSVTDRARVWAAPVFRPLDNLTAAWALDMSEPAPTWPAPVPADAEHLQRRVQRLEAALAEATARLGDYDRRVRDLAHIREGLDGLPCRLVPARLISPEVAGGRSPAMLSKGFSSGVRAGEAIIQARLNRGAREALAAGEPVLTAAGLFGVVEEVGPLTSTVRLLTDPETRIMVQIVAGRDGRWRPGPDGLAAQGAGDGRTLAIEHVPRTADVSVGDYVVTSPSPESRLPAYLIVGRVARAGPHPKTPLFDSLVVDLQVAPDTAGEVYVLSRETAPER